MHTDLLNHPNYRQREKTTRTRIAARIWQQLSEASPPRGLSYLFKEQTHIEPEFEVLLKSKGLDSVQSVFDFKQGRLITTAGLYGGEDVSRVELEDGSKIRTFYIKRYWNREFRRILKRATRGSIFGASIMGREFMKMKELNKMGVPTLKLVAYGDQRFCGAVINTFMITEELPDALGVDTLAVKWRSEPKRHRAEQNCIIEACARHLKQMHAHGFEHHDLYFRNIMVSKQDPSKITIFDCPRAFQWPNWLIKKRRINDLATLDAVASAVLTSTQRMRFMHFYLGCQRLTPHHKKLITKVLQRAEPHRMRQLRRLERALKD